VPWVRRRDYGLSAISCPDAVKLHASIRLSRASRDVKIREDRLRITDLGANRLKHCHDVPALFGLAACRISLGCGELSDRWRVVAVGREPSFLFGDAYDDGGSRH